MSLKNIVKLAKGNEYEKIGISLKVPQNVKDRLEDLSKKEKISVNALINAMIINGFEDVPVTKELYLELNDLEKKLFNCLLPESAGGEEFNGYFVNPGALETIEDEMLIIMSRVKALRKILL